MNGTNLDAIEAGVRDSAAGDSPDRATALEALIAALLASAGFSPGATDGFVPLREEPGGNTYFGVGKLYMIEDQSWQPVCIELAFAPAGPVRGTVRYGVPLREHKGPRLENALLAYPRETATTLQWTHVFERGPTGWLQREAT